MGITYVHSQIQTTVKDLQSNFEHLISILTQQIQHTNHRNHQFDELKLGIIDLVKGKFSPLVLSPDFIKSTNSDIQQLLNFKYPGFYVGETPVNQMYSANRFLSARQNNNLYSTITFSISAHRLHNPKLF